MSRIASSSLALILAATAMCSAAEKPRQWQLGLLREMNAESWTSTSTAPVTCTYGSGCSGGQTSSWGHETFTLAISDGDQTYVVARTLSFRWQHDPKVTENSLMKFSVQGNQLILVGDDGREFKAHITKKRINTVADQLQECSLITEVLSRKLSGFKDVELLLVLGRFATCGIVGMNTKNIPLIQSVQRSTGSLLSEEERRIKVKDGASISDAAIAQASTPCAELWTRVEDKKSLNSATDSDLLGIFHVAQNCVAEQISGATGILGPIANRGQQDLAIEGLKRLNAVLVPVP